MSIQYHYQTTTCVFQGKEVIEYYINELIEEGVNHIPRWTCPPEHSIPAGNQHITVPWTCTCEQTGQLIELYQISISNFFLSLV